MLGKNPMSALQTYMYRREPSQLRWQSKPSPAARDPTEVSLALEAGYFNTVLVCYDSSNAGTPPISGNSSRKQDTAYTRLQVDIST